jgi:hypothetical protein
MIGPNQLIDFSFLKNKDDRRWTWLAAGLAAGVVVGT